MSERELQRRKLTGTLASCTVTASVAALGLGGDRFVHAADTSTRESLEKEVNEFYTELSSKFFQAPTQIIIPTNANRKSGRLCSWDSYLINYSLNKLSKLVELKEPEVISRYLGVFSVLFVLQPKAWEISRTYILGDRSGSLKEASNLKLEVGTFANMPKHLAKQCFFRKLIWCSFLLFQLS